MPKPVDITSPEFFKKPIVKKFKVTIEGKELEVELKKKLEIQQVGEDKYMLEGNNIVLKPKPKTNRTFPMLEAHNQDPYWIETDEGILWQINSE